MIDNKLICGDSLKILKEMKEATIDLIYMDPPFFTQDIQLLVSKQKQTEFSFSDKLDSMDDYLILWKNDL